MCPSELLGQPKPSLGLLNYPAQRRTIVSPIVFRYVIWYPISSQPTIWRH